MALVLALLVLLILVAVISQLVISTALDDTAARNEALRTQMVYATDTALLEASDRIKEDYQEDGGAAGGGAGPGGMGGGLGSMMGALSGDAGSLGAGLGGGAADGGEQDPGVPGDGSQEDQAATDSLEDSWADVLETEVGRVHLTVHVEDEQRRFNLLSCLSDDEEWADRSRGILVRILDIVREDTPYDVSFSDAEEIADRMIEWMEGQGRNEDLPRPDLLSDLEDDERSLPWGLREFLMVDGVDPFLFYDTWSDDGRPVPGLESVLTVWTSLADGSAQAEAEAAEAAEATPALGPLSGGAEATAQMEGGQQPSVGGNRASPLPGNPPVPAALGGPGTDQESRGALVNLNTAAPAVLKALVATTDLPGEIVDAILEWRQELVEGEEADARRQDALDDDDPFNDDEEGPRNVFSKVDDLGLVEAFADFDDADSKQMLAELLDVQSDVFTIYVTARVIPTGSEEAARLSAGEPLEEPWKEPPGLAMHVQSVVWRTGGPEGPQLIPVIPWEERAAPKVNHAWWARNEDHLWY